MSEGPIEETIQPVEHFVNTTLKEELSAVLYTKQSVENERKEYEWMQNELERQLKEGSNFYCQAITQNDDRLHMKLSYGYIVEMKRSEAAAFCREKVKLLQRRSDFLDMRSSTIQEHMKQLLLGVAELRLSAELGLE